MFVKIIAIFWIVLGALWFIKPEMLKGRSLKKTNRRLRWMFLIILITLIVKCGNLIFAADTATLKVLLIIAIIVMIRLMFYFFSKASEKLIKWWGELPIIAFRIWALIIIGSGVALYYFK